jgi:hypothetical protein
MLLRKLWSCFLQRLHRLRNPNEKEAGMIHISPLMEFLNDDRYAFHLTGSRYFGCMNRDSDWDFFIQIPSSEKDREDLYKFLTSAGFICVSHEPHYIDVNCLALFLHPKAHTHVQIVESAGIKLISQEIFKALGITKPEIEQWSQLYNYLKDNKEVIMMFAQC